MASNKTPKLNLDIWAPDDFFKRAEVNTNFEKLDAGLAELAKRSIYVTEDPYNAKGDGVTDDTEAFLAAIHDASGSPVYVPLGSYLVALDLTDEDVHLIGPGTLIHQQAKNVIKIKRTLGPSLDVTGISTVQIGPNNPGVGVFTETNTKITVSGSLSGVSQGNLFHISSQDIYPFCTQMSVVKNSTINVWKAGFVSVHGIGLDISSVTGGGITENNIVTGATSGATALVLSVATPTAGNAILVFGKVTGDFVNGESLLVNGFSRGVVNGSPYIIMAGKLIDTYTTSPVLRKVPTDKKFIIDGLSVKASGDVDSVVGSANRLPAFQLMGVYRPEVRNFTIESAWTRCWQLNSCWHGDINVHIKKLPNNDNDSEGAYGYGVELGGATEGCIVTVSGGNCRHAFTTNVFWGGFSYMDPLLCGTVKYNTVHNSFIDGALSASFDTHEGAYFTSFENCRSIGSRSGLRNTTASTGFQNRGFGTTYRNCYDRG